MLSVALAEGRIVRDLRAYSIAAPVDLDDRYAPTWPAFILDLIPQGRHARRIAEFMQLDPNAASTEIELLKRCAGSPVCNLRVKEAHLLEAGPIAEMSRVGVTMHDILKRDATFLEMGITSRCSPPDQQGFKAIGLKSR